VCVLIAAVVGGLTLNVFAAEEEKGTSQFKEHWLSVWQVLNFFILAFLVFKLLKDPLKKYFQQGSEVVREQLEQAENASLQAEQELEAVHRRFEVLDEEILKLQESISEQGEREREAIIASAGQSAAYLMEKARLECEMMLRQAKIRLHREVIDESLRLAEEKVRKAIKDSDQKRLVDEYVKSLKKVPRASTG
jgi:F-type H+-transporting ATPase subunit b